MNEDCNYAVSKIGVPKGPGAPQNIHFSQATCIVHGGNIRGKNAKVVYLLHCRELCSEHDFTTSGLLKHSDIFFTNNFKKVYSYCFLIFFINTCEF